VAVRPDRENRPALVEGDDFDVGPGLGDDVGDLRQHVLQAPDRVVGVDGVVDLRQQVDAAEGVAAEVLDRPVHDLGVAHHRLDVVGRVDRGVEEPDHAHRAFDIAGNHVVADLERPQHEDERPGGEVGQQAAPRRADCNAEAGHERGERRRLDAEVAEDGDDQNDVQRDGNDRADVADDGRLDLLRLERLHHQVRGEADQHPADDVRGDGAEHLQAEGDDDGLCGFDHAGDVHDVPLWWVKEKRVTEQGCRAPRKAARPRSSAPRALPAGG
jgi:hypothetical protein